MPSFSPTYRHRRLLRARRERPSSRAAEQRNELATLHSITSSIRGSGFMEYPAAIVRVTPP
jgi:hypothetical protein